jgi:Cap4, dsDNA endonuclease domain
MTKKECLLVDDSTHNAEVDKEEKGHEWPSVDVAKPIEEGGPDARKGFNYQDEIAVSFLLDMMEDDSIVKIHCETHDDILVVRATEEMNQNCAEYVQVKATEPKQLWTFATLCQRKNGKEGTSVLERSLAHDCHKEHSRFRILTLRQVSPELKILTNPIGSVGREPCCAALQDLKQEIDKKRPGLVSSKGNDSAFWLDNCHWDERHNEDVIRTSNRFRVFQISSAQNNTLLQDAIDSLLDDMRAWVKSASASKWEPDRDKKIITREQLIAWWDQRVAELTSAGGAAGGKLVRKMKTAHLPQDVINLAVDLRRSYTRSLRTPRYADDENTEELLSRVRAEAISLRSRYTAGQLDVDAPTFHSICLDRMDAINVERPDGEPDRSSFLKGCLYDIADRCLLRFERIAS